MVPILTALVISAPAPSIMLEHCIDLSNQAAPYCFIEVVEPAKVTLLTRAVDLQFVLETPLLPEMDGYAELFKQYEFSVEVIPDSSYIAEQGKALGGFSYQFAQDSIPGFEISSFGFEKDLTVEQQRLSPPLSSRDQQLMACESRCAHGVVGRMMTRASSEAFAWGAAAGALGFTLGSSPVTTVVSAVGGGFVGFLYGATGYHEGMAEFSNDEAPRSTSSSLDSRSVDEVVRSDLQPEPAEDSSSESEAEHDEVGTQLSRVYEYDSSGDSESEQVSSSISDENTTMPNPEKAPTEISEEVANILAAAGVLDERRRDLGLIIPGTPIPANSPLFEIKRIDRLDTLILHDKVQKMILSLDARINRPNVSTLVNPGKP